MNETDFEKEITVLLNEGKINEATSFLYNKLTEIANIQLNKLHPGETLNTASLVNELYLKVSSISNKEWKNRRHFLAVSAKAMRWIIVNAIEKKMAKKRGGDLIFETIDDQKISVSENGTQLLALNEALDLLEDRSVLQAKIVELRYFGGHTIEETARIAGVSVSTVKREWRNARLWLTRVIRES